jgi:ABC-type Zn uptake system ZnuABC Zn-binding protein ZnuA
MESYILKIQKIEKLLLEETDPAKRRLYRKIIKETIAKLEQLKSA